MSSINVEKNKASKWTRYFLCACIVVGAVLRIIPYIYDKSLWVDEAMLASSICTRSLKTLVLSPLDWGQSASIGWLYIVKVLTILFGTSEAVFRSWSLVTSFGCIIMLYLLLKERVHNNYALFFTAIYSLNDMYIYYAYEAKPYMSDNLGCLLILFFGKDIVRKKFHCLN